MEEGSETVTGHEDTTSRRRVIFSASSAPPSGWALDELLVLRDVSILVGTPFLCTLATSKLYQQTLEHFLTFIARRNLPTSYDAQMEMALAISSNNQTSAHHRGNSLLVAIMHRHQRYSRLHRCLRGWKLLTPGRTRKAFLLHMWSSIEVKLGLSGRRRMVAFYSVMLCGYARPSELTKPIKCGAVGWKNRIHITNKKQKGPPVSFFLPLFLDRIHQSVSVLQSPMGHPLSSSTFLLQHRPSNEREAPQ